MSVFEQPVAHPPDVDDERTSAGAGELAAQAGRVRVQGARLADRAEAPDLAQQLFLREDAARLRCELEQQLVLLRRQVDPLAADRDATGEGGAFPAPPRRRGPGGPARAPRGGPR